MGLSVFTSRKLNDYEQQSTAEDYNREPDFVLTPIKFVPKDFLMPERDPGYNDFKIPFDVKCKIRYSEARRRYEKQFQREIKSLFNDQDTGSDAAYLTRHMAYTTLGPPLHSKKEVDRSSKLCQLTNKERRRLRYS